MTRCDTFGFIFIFCISLAVHPHLAAWQLCTPLSANKTLTGGLFRCELFGCILTTLPQPLLLQNRSRCFTVAPAVRRACFLSTAAPFVFPSPCQQKAETTKCALCLSTSGCILWAPLPLCFLFLFKGYQEISLCNTHLLFPKAFLYFKEKMFYLISKTI